MMLDNAEKQPNILFIMKEKKVVAALHNFLFYLASNINFQDFVKYWDQFEICHLSSDTFEAENNRGWSTHTFNGKI